MVNLSGAERPAQSCRCATGRRLARGSAAEIFETKDIFCTVGLALEQPDGVGISNHKAARRSYLIASSITASVFILSVVRLNSRYWGALLIGRSGLK